MPTQDLLKDVLDLIEQHKTKATQLNSPLPPANIDLQQILKLFYLVEAELVAHKSALHLPTLNPTIQSTGIVASFDRNPMRDLGFIPHDDYFRPLDYQYYFLAHLLRFNSQIEDTRFSLHEVIDIFIKNASQSLQYEDILVTASGRTRCDTNLRFCVQQLRDIGLLKVKKKKRKANGVDDEINIWSLSFIGVFVAASFILEPYHKRNHPFSKALVQCPQSDYLFKIDELVWKSLVRIFEDANHFKHILHDFLGVTTVQLITFPRIMEIPTFIEGILKEVQKGHIMDAKARKKHRDMLSDRISQFDADIQFEEFWRIITVQNNLKSIFERWFTNFHK